MQRLDRQRKVMARRYELEKKQRSKGSGKIRDRLMRPRGNSTDGSDSRGQRTASSGSGGASTSSNLVSEQASASSGKSSRRMSMRQHPSASQHQRSRHQSQRKDAESAAGVAEDSIFPSLDEIFSAQLDDSVDAKKDKVSLQNPDLFSRTKPKGRYPVTKRLLRMNLSQASDNYPVIPRVCKLMGWKRAKETSEGDAVLGDWSIAWRDTGAVSVTTVRELIGGM